MGHQDLLSASLGLTCKKWPMFCLTNRTSKIVSLWWDETNLQNHGINCEVRQTDKTNFGRAISEGSQIHSIDKVATCAAQEEKIMAPTGTRQPTGQIQLFVSVANSEHRVRLCLRKVCDWFWTWTAGRALVTETRWPAKSKLFMILTFSENVYRPLL